MYAKDINHIFSESGTLQVSFNKIGPWKKHLDKLLRGKVRRLNCAHLIKFCLIQLLY
jgi:hypothetical protein